MCMGARRGSGGSIYLEINGGNYAGKLLGRSMEGGEWDRYEIDIEDNGILGIHQQEQVSPKRRPLTV